MQKAKSEKRDREMTENVTAVNLTTHQQPQLTRFGKDTLKGEKISHDSGRLRLPSK